MKTIWNDEMMTNNDSVKFDDDMITMWNLMMTMCNLMELIIMTLMKFNNYDDMKFVKFDDNDVKFLIIFLFLSFI